MSSVPQSLVAPDAAGFASRAWRVAGAIVFVLGCVFLAYWPSSDSLMQSWSNTGKITYTHGYVIAALVVWMVWRRRDQLAAIPWSPSIPASLLAAALGIAWLVAVQSGIEIIHQLLMQALLASSVWAIFGIRMALQLSVPIGYLIFAIPVWEQINFLLQEATVRAVALFLALTSIPAFVEGNFVHLAAGVFEVAGGCSGLHFFIVALALATLYGEIGRDPLKFRIQTVVLGAVLALMANWIRVYIIVVAGHLTNMEHFLIRGGHYNFGWMVFAVMMVVFFLLARRFAPAAAQERVPRAPAPVVASRGVGLAIAVVCLVAIPAWQFLRRVEPAALPAANTLLPHVPAGWSVVADSASAWNPVFAGADRVERAEYASSSGQRVQVFVAAYASQRQNKELVGYGNALIGPDEGTIVSSARAAAGEVARELVVQGADGRSIIHYHYDIGGRRTDRGIVAQLWYGIGASQREPLSSVVAVRTVCGTDCDAARALLREISAPE